MISSPAASAIPRIWTKFFTAVCIASLAGVVWVFSDRRSSPAAEAVPEPWTIVRSSLVLEQAHRPSDLLRLSTWRPRMADFINRQPVSPAAAAILNEAVVAATVHDPALRYGSSAAQRAAK